MIDRAAVLYPITDPSEWAERYGLEPFATPCPRCDVLHVTERPFAQGRLRGLMAPQCECGHPTPPYCAVAVDGDLFGALEDV
jgi:hypothetical protein